MYVLMKPLGSFCWNHCRIADFRRVNRKMWMRRWNMVKLGICITEIRFWGAVEEGRCFFLIFLYHRWSCLTFFRGKRRGLISSGPEGELLSTKGARATIIFLERWRVFGEWFPVTLAEHDETMHVDSFWKETVRSCVPLLLVWRSGCLLFKMFNSSQGNSQ